MGDTLILHNSQTPRFVSAPGQNPGSKIVTEVHM